jgi:Flp pilus assembly protein CpaB
MSRRARAAAFLALALLAAAAAAATVAGYGSSVTRGYGPLRPVVVVEAGLAAGRPIGPAEVASSLIVRRIPERFVPAGALTVPREALGLAPRGPAPAGSYLLAGQLRAPRPERRPGLGDDRRPVEITVSGAGALAALGRPLGARVDVVVTAEPSGPGPGRTFVAAAGVPLLALGPGEDGPGPGGTSAATLGLTRRQALRLIAAESFARKLTLLPQR